MTTDPRPFPEDDPTREQRPFAENLVREEGVLVEPGSRDVGCDPDDEVCPTDDFANDPHADGAHSVPGTVDDAPMNFGIELPTAGDRHLVPEGATHQGGRQALSEERETPEGKRDENELWSEQKALINEDEAEGLRLQGFSEEEIPAILAAMGDDAEDALQDAPNGSSATGSGNEPAHGGFPER